MIFFKRFANKNAVKKLSSSSVAFSRRFTQHRARVWLWQTFVFSDKKFFFYLKNAKHDTFALKNLLTLRGS